MIAGIAEISDPAISTGMSVVRPGRQRAQADGDRALGLILQKQQADQQVIPDLDELEHEDRRQRRHRHRQRHPHEDHRIGQAVHHAGLDQLVGQAAVVHRHQKRRKRRADGRVHQHRPR